MLRLFRRVPMAMQAMAVVARVMGSGIGVPKAAW